MTSDFISLFCVVLCLCWKLQWPALCFRANHFSAFSIDRFRGFRFSCLISFPFLPFRFLLCSLLFPPPYQEAINGNLATYRFDVFAAAAVAAASTALHSSLKPARLIVRSFITNNSGQREKESSGDFLFGAFAVFLFVDCELSLSRFFLKATQKKILEEGESFFGLPAMLFFGAWSPLLCLVGCCCCPVSGKFAFPPLSLSPLFIADHFSKKEWPPRR